ncbi:ribosome-binding factor A [Sporobacter termitidis DSM 10068]|uniref:Ribosome-binding factor A n=1 Tax=Sporobacter termitidis DSM 10068 TaxID=1123282 RepID=A0A1M5XY64_9FIRM|nr:30S ribosome-binding factor RbfA [Sporobacter termitidis]SHI04488.1 ribosome-binding factor A [Sporobacter termitidis DSM 10068]
MASNKIGRINEDIQRVMSSLLRNVKDPRVNQGMTSITAVDTTGDLRYCKIYLSVMGLQSEKELMKGLKSAAGYLRRELGNSLQLRYTPELIFQLDRSIEHGANISKILNKLEDAPPAQDEGTGESHDHQ